MLGWILAAIGVTAVASAMDSSTQEKRDEIRNLEAQNNEKIRRLQAQNNEMKRYLEAQNNEIRYLKEQNNFLVLTIENQQSLLSNFDYVNKYAKGIGYKGAVQFFYFLAQYHDERFMHYAKFLDKVRHIRNDVAHNGSFYQIDEWFLKKLSACKYICDEHARLPSYERLRLS